MSFVHISIVTFHFFSTNMESKEASEATVESTDIQISTESTQVAGNEVKIENLSINEDVRSNKESLPQSKPVRQEQALATRQTKHLASGNRKP